MDHKRRGRIRKKESIASLSFGKAWDRQMQNIEMEKELETLGEFRNGNNDIRQKKKKQKQVKQKAENTKHEYEGTINIYVKMCSFLEYPSYTQL